MHLLTACIADVLPAGAWCTLLGTTAGEAELRCSRRGGLAVAGVGGGCLGDAEPEVPLAAATIPTSRLSSHSHSCVVP